MIVRFSFLCSKPFFWERGHDRRERVKKSRLTVNAAERDCFARGINECLFLS